MAGAHTQRMHDIYACNLVKQSSGSVFTKNSQEHSLSFPPKFGNWNVIQLLIGYTVWFSQSEVVLHSNASKYRNDPENTTKNVVKNGL